MVTKNILMVTGNRLVISILISWLIVQTTFAQSEINNVKTALHQHVPGTRFFLIPPMNFNLSKSFQGFQESETGSSIMVMEIPGPFAESTRGFTQDGLKPSGVNLQKRQDIKVNGKPGMFLIADQESEGTVVLKYILVFGDEQGTRMVNGTFPRNVSLYHKDIIESMLSVVYDSTIIVDKLEGVPFGIDISDTKLKIAHNLSGTLMYTTDGRVPPESPDRTLLMVGSSQGESIVVNRRQAAVERVRQLPYPDLKIDEKNITSVSIDGISGYEITAQGTSATGIHEFVYQVMLFSDTDYYVIVGITNENFTGNLELFRKVAASFHRK